MNIINRLKKIALPSFVALIFLFLYIPVFIIVLFSFNKSPLAYTWTGFTFDWYRQLFAQKQIWICLLNSIIVAGSAVFLSITAGTFFIWGLVSRYNGLMSLFYATMMIPDVMIAASLLTFFTFFSVPLGFPSLIVGHTLIGLGLAVPIIYSRFVEIDNQIIEASMNLGATQWQTFKKIILPFLKPSMLSAAISVIILSLDDFVISFFCAGADSQTLSLYIFSIIRTGASPVINALSTLILLFSTLFVLFVRLFKIRTERLKL